MSTEPFEFDDLAPMRAAGATHQRTLEAIVDEARERGRQEGFDAGRREALEALAPAGDSLAQALIESAREHEEFLAQAEQAAAELAVALAGKILGAAIEVRPQAVLDVVAGTLRRTVKRDQLVLEVSPEDFTLVRDSAERIAEQIGGVRRLDVVAERRVGRGGCIVRTEEGEVDGQIAEQLDRARELVAELLGVTATDA